MTRSYWTTASIAPLLALAGCASDGTPTDGSTADSSPDAGDGMAGDGGDDGGDSGMMMVDSGGDSGMMMVDSGGLCDGVDCSGLDDTCNTGVCSPATGACMAMPLMDGAACDDGSLCTIAGSCTLGVCAGMAIDCSGSSDLCNAGVCDPTNGSCTPMPVADGTGCDDGLCSSGNTCTGGTCGGGTSVDCTSLTDGCNAGTCDPATGTCSAVPLMNGTSCSTAFCTGGEVCTAGICGGGSPVDCTGLTDQCNVGECVVDLGTCSANPVADGIACDDGNMSTSEDQCTSGVCGGCPDSDIAGPYAYAVQQRYSPRTLGAGATTLTLGNDDSSAPIALGFPYSFFGAPVTNVSVMSNGFLRFDATSTSSGCCSGQTLPSATMADAGIAAFWEDLNPPAGGTVRYEVQGAAPNREWVLEFSAIQHLPSGTPVTFQVVLPEGTNEADVICIDCPSDGGNHTQGVQSGGTGVGYSLPGREAADISLFGDHTRYYTGLSVGGGDGCDAVDACPAINASLGASAAASGGDHASARSVPVARRTFFGPNTLSLVDEEVTGALPLGFDFDFFGTTFTDVHVSSNGFITFEPGATDTGCCTGGFLPDGTNPGSMIAAYWADLRPPGGGTIRYQTLGTAPNREWVLEFDGVTHYFSSDPVTFQIVLHETSNEAEIICIDCSGGVSAHTQGVQNAARDYGYSAGGRDARFFNLTNDAVIYTTTSGEASICDLP